MGALTKYDALLGELEPYTPSPLTLKKALIDANVADYESEYVAKEDGRKVAVAAISVLKRLIVLSSDSLGKSSQSYNVEGLKKRINDICHSYNLESSYGVEVPTITDGSNMW